MQLYADVTLSSSSRPASLAGSAAEDGVSILPVRRTRKPVTFPFVALCCRRGRRLAFTPHLYQCLGTRNGIVDFDAGVLAQFMLMGDVSKAVHLVGGEYLVPL